MDYGNLDHLGERKLAREDAGWEEEQTTPEEEYAQETNKRGTDPIQQYGSPPRKVTPQELTRQGLRQNPKYLVPDPPLCAFRWRRAQIALGAPGRMPSLGRRTLCRYVYPKIFQEVTRGKCFSASWSPMLLSPQTAPRGVKNFTVLHFHSYSWMHFAILVLHGKHNLFFRRQNCTKTKIKVFGAGKTLKDLTCQAIPAQS